MAERQLIGGRYELTVPIGSGGMGEVWEAYDRSLDRRIAVKLLRRARLPAGSDPHKASRAPMPRPSRCLHGGTR